jgi:hypothetical protein
MKRPIVKKEQVRINDLVGARPVIKSQHFYGFSGKSKTFKKNQRRGL